MTELEKKMAEIAAKRAATQAKAPKAVEPAAPKGTVEPPPPVASEDDIAFAMTQPQGEINPPQVDLKAPVPSAQPLAATVSSSEPGAITLQLQPGGPPVTVRITIALEQA